MSKQDRQGVRTPADLEQKYNFGKNFSEAKETNSKRDTQLNQLSQNIAQYMAVTNSVIAELSAQILTQSIVNEVVGANIALTDSAKFKLQALSLYGKSTQNGTPAQTTPIVIESIGNNVVITIEGDLNAQTLSVNIPDSLCGIPVDNNGNYTDENGQNWICDEIDFERGLFVQRIGRIESYVDEEIGAVFMSTTGELTTGATVIYPLNTPIETPLSADVLKNYATLQTNYPETAIYNDVGGGMKAKYVADTKNYIDNKVR